MRVVGWFFDDVGERKFQFLQIQNSLRFFMDTTLCSTCIFPLIVDDLSFDVEFDAPELSRSPNLALRLVHTSLAIWQCVHRCFGKSFHSTSHKATGSGSISKFLVSSS
jgi:hypothetical protein